MKKMLWLFLLCAFAAPAAAEDLDFGSGPNMSGESTASDRRRLFKEDSTPERNYTYQRFAQNPPAPGSGIRTEDNMRIDVPRMPDGRPWRPVRGLSRTEEMEMDDLEYRYAHGQIGEAEYYSRRNALMERLGMEAEY